MSYTAQSGRQQILEDVASAAEGLGHALASLSEAYEHLDERLGDQMEETLFRPPQSAYGQLKRTHAEFAERYGLGAREFPSAPAPLPGDPRRMLEQAAEAIQSADDTLAALQDSLLPVEVGDEALRAGLSHVRVLVGPLPAVSSQLVRTIGR